MNIFLTFLIIALSLLILERFCVRYPKGMLRLAKIAGTLVLVLGILIGCYIAYDFDRIQKFERKKELSQQGDRKLIAAVEKYVSEGGKLIDLDNDTLTGLTEAYENVYGAYYSQNIKKIRLSKYPDPATVWSQANEEAKALKP